MIKKVPFLAVFFILFVSCASNRAVVRPDYDFASVKTVRVGKFSPDAMYPNSASAVQNAFMKNLLAKGYRIVADANSEADALIEGSVTTFQPDKKYLIRTPENDKRGRHQPVIYTNDVVEISGSNMYDLGTAFGLGEDNKIMASNATVGVYAYMVDAETGEVVWTDSYTYEGIDLSSALDGAVRYILRSLPRENIVSKE